MDHKPLSRRTVVGAATVVSAAFAANACDVLSTAPGGSGEASPTGGDLSRQREAPALARLVRSGKLPNLGKRLPSKPLTVKPDRRSGGYGGTARMIMFGVTGTVVIGRTLAYETLMRWTPDYSKVIPNVARSVQVADSGRRYTFKLRPGMKWSDG